MIPDRQWGFVAPGRTDHPGVCLHVHPQPQQAVFLKGTNAASRFGSRYYIVEPTEANGLEKLTAFDIAPRILALQRVRWWSAEPRRRCGRVTNDELAEMRAVSEKLFPNVNW